jgi:prepilin-type N-terminal cleavage/methylation domain-containing protein
MKNENIMNKNKGFTLIEMLVVIAMIGLLSAVVLVALGPSRNKAKDARIMSDVKQIVAIGQTFYDPTNSTYDVSGIQSATGTNQAASDITQQGVSFNTSTNIGGDTTAFRVYAQLLSGGYFCADSNGNVVQSSSISGFTTSSCK